jgi:hypothetical protein
MIFMIIESIIGLVVIAAVVYLSWKVIKNDGSNTDLNQDGKTDIKDAAVVVEKLAVKVAKAADVNKDGKISIDDAKVVAETVKTKINETVEKGKSVAKKIKKSTQEVKPEPVVSKAPKRARNKGKLVADNPVTPVTNEAWVDGKAPEPKAKPKKPKKPKMTVVK